MAVLNAMLARAVDGLLYPFQDQPPLVGLMIVSLLSALAILAIVRFSSDQTRIRQVRRHLQACVFEIRLFSDDARAMMRAVGEAARHSVTYVRLFLVPALWMSVPLGLFIGHLHVHYGYGGLELNQPALIKVHLSPPDEGEVASASRSASVVPTLGLTVPPGIRVDTPALWIPSLNEAVWRIVPERPGSYDVTVHVGPAAFRKAVEVSSAIVRRPPVRADAGILNHFLHPAEPPLPRHAAVDAITVTYPRRRVGILGREVHWMAVYFALSMVFGLLLRRRMNVAL